MTAPAFNRCGGRVAWVPVSDDLDADAYRAAVAGGVL